ncbi:putative ribonuclease H-like domain-containing protein [Tanacetum coccineum]
MAFVSSNSTHSNSNNSTNKAYNTAYGVSAAHIQYNPTFGDNLSDDMICAFLDSQPNSPQLAREDLEQIDPDDLEEIDLQWEMAMLTIRARRFIKRIGRKIYSSRGHTLEVETPTKNALVAQDGIGGYDWSYQAEEEHPTNFALMAYTSSGSSSSSDSEVDSCSKSCVKAYATLKEQYDSLSSDYKKSQFNLVSYKAGLESVEARLAHYKKNEAVFEESINVLNLEVKLRDNALVENKKKLEKAEKERDELNTLIYNAASLLQASPAIESFEIAEEPKTIRKNSFRPHQSIEDWNSDDDSEVEFIPNVKDKTVRPSTEKIKFVKSVRETVKKQKEYKEKGVIDSGCSRHMTGNKCYLTEYEDYDGGFVSFGDGKGRISGKVLPLSFDFKLLMKVKSCWSPRKDNIYSVDLKSVVPTKGLTCLFAKATIDESNLWHRRLGHINFKNMNKLVRGNLVRGLPLKIFENDHSCVASQKGKQHKASCKAKLVNSISKPLHMLPYDHLVPTEQMLKQLLMKKSYCLVVTDNFSRFPRIFFLATKDETSRILKTFITEIENQLDYKVKVIKSDNGTEFKNSVMNQFCEMKGIKREFSVARNSSQMVFWREEE